MFLLPRGIGVLCLFLAVPWVGLWSVIIVVYPDHAHLFLIIMTIFISKISVHVCDNLLVDQVPRL